MPGRNMQHTGGFRITDKLRIRAEKSFFLPLPFSKMMFDDAPLVIV